MTKPTAQIVPAQFPELKNLAWNRDPDRPVPAEEVFALYRRNWRFVDCERLTPAERQLIQELEKQYGHGSRLL